MRTKKATKKKRQPKNLHSYLTISLKGERNASGSDRIVIKSLLNCPQLLGKVAVAQKKSNVKANGAAWKNSIRWEMLMWISERARYPFFVYFQRGSGKKRYLLFLSSLAYRWWVVGAWMCDENTHKKAEKGDSIIEIFSMKLVEILRIPLYHRWRRGWWRSSNRENEAKSILYGRENIISVIIKIEMSVRCRPLNSAKRRKLTGNSIKTYDDDDDVCCCCSVSVSTDNSPRRFVFFCVLKSKTLLPGC